MHFHVLSYHSLHTLWHAFGHKHTHTHTHTLPTQLQALKRSVMLSRLMIDWDVNLISRRSWQFIKSTFPLYPSEIRGRYGPRLVSCRGPSCQEQQWLLHPLSLTLSRYLSNSLPPSPSDFPSISPSLFLLVSLPLSLFLSLSHLLSSVYLSMFYLRPCKSVLGLKKGFAQLFVFKCLCLAMFYMYFSLSIYRLIAESLYLFGSFHLSLSSIAPRSISDFLKMQYRHTTRTDNTNTHSHK